MKVPLPFLARSLGALTLVCLASASCNAQNLLINGGFDHKDGPLTGWITDYAFTENSNYVGNKDAVSVVDGKAVFKDVGDAGAKMETRPIALEPGFKYTAKLDVKGERFRIYIAGYKWKPGIRPHENPDLAELRMIYKSKAVADGTTVAKSQTVELPGVKLSPQAKTALKEVRFISVFIYMLDGGTVDNVVLTKTPDPEMKF